jgi:hypothetical protein
MDCVASKNFPAEMSLTSDGLAGFTSRRGPSVVEGTRELDKEISSFIQPLCG